MSGQKIDDIHLPSFCVKQQRGKRKTKRFQSAAAGAGEHEGCTVELFMKGLRSFYSALPCPYPNFTSNYRV